MAAIGKVAAVFSASTGALEAGVERAANALRGLGGSASNLATRLGGIASSAAGSAIHGIGSAAERAAHTFFHMAESQAEVIDSNSKLADRLGLTYEELAGLKLAGDLADVSIESLAKAMVKSDVAFVRAGEGSKKAMSAIENLGISFDDLNGKTAAERFSTVADAIAEMKNPAVQAEAAVTLFGKSGASLLPLFRKGKGEIEKAAEEAKKFGLALTNVQAKNVEDMNDSFKKVSEVMKGIAGQVVANLAPAITKVTEEFVKFVGTVGGENIGTAIADALMIGAKFLARVGDYFIENLPAVFDTLQSIASLWMNVWDAGERIANLFFACWKAFEAVGNAIGAAITTVIERLLRAAAAIADWIPGLGDVADNMNDAADRWGQTAVSYSDAFSSNVQASGQAFKAVVTGAAPEFGSGVAGGLETSVDDMIAKIKAARQEAEMAAKTPIDVKQTVELMEGAKVTVEGLDGRAIDGVRQAIVDGESVQEQQLSRLERIQQAVEEWSDEAGDGGVDLIEADFAY